MLLFLTQVLPYPLSGGAKIRAYYVIRYLAQKHPVTLVSFVREDDTPEAVAHLRGICHAVHTVPIVRSRLRDGRALLESLVTDRPAVIARDRMPAMEQLLARLLRETTFTAVHADQTAMAQYALFAGKQQPELPLVLDQHNALYQLVQRQAGDERSAWRRRLWQAEARRLARYETELCRQFDHIFTVTEADRQTLLELLPPAEAQDAADRFTAVPICVDPSTQPPLTPAPDSNQVIFLGTMFWPPNIEGVLWFAEEVWPRVVAQRPEAHFVIAGKNPPPAVQKLARAGASPAEAGASPAEAGASPAEAGASPAEAGASPAEAGASPAEAGASPAGRITVTGFVADPLPLLSESAVFVVPLKAGGGMRVKIVDGWQWALPIVSTTIGAEGLEIRPGENILIADDPESFATAVLRLLADPQLAQRLRQNGRQWVEERYNWRTVYRQFDAVYDALLGTR
jgi:polysaccharide biosynthesis protein PslH